MKKSYSPPQLTTFDSVEGLTRGPVLVLIALSLALRLIFPTESISQVVFPGSTWIVTSPEAVGLSRSSLDSLWSYTGGTGFVSRYGYQAYAWGDYTDRSDFASASKTFLSFFLFKAIEEGRLDNLDVEVNIFEPCLNTINANLGYKDRNITFRHMATQTSNYGVSEAPGTAFNYNDWQTALFADTLFQNVYQSSYSMVDQQVLNPLLVDILQMEDAPTLQPGPGRMQLSTRDFVRFGLLFLHRGTWNGTRVLSSTHATMAVTDPLPNTLPQSTGIPADMCPGQRTWGSADISGNQIDHEGSYSWLWWTNGINQSGQRLFPDAPPDTYGAFGHGGKRAIVVLPSLHLVVSWNDTHLSSWPKVNEALRRLVVAVTGHHHPATSPDGGRAATVLSDESTAIPPFTATSTSTATVLWMNPQPHLSQSDAPYKGGTPGIQMFHAAWCSRAVQNVPYHLLEDVDMSHNSFKATGTTRCPAWHRNNHVNRPRLNGRIQELNTS